MSQRALVVYASTHGHTARIAERIAAGLRAGGLEVALEDVRRSPDATPAGFDAVVVGGSIHQAAHQPELVAWIHRHNVELSTRRSAFFSVSLSAADDTDEGRAITRDAIDDVLDDTGWIPGLTAAFAGALQYREYDVFTRILMRLVARHHGLSTDTSADVDLTDWDAVERFAADVVDLTVRQGAPS